MLNVVALHGRLIRAVETRVLSTGTPVLGLELSVRRDDASRAESVPVVWHEPPDIAKGLDAGDEVVVVGRVVRRFFRAGGGTQSRTEVIASTVVPARSAKKASAALRAALQEVEAAANGNGNGKRAKGGSG